MTELSEEVDAEVKAACSYGDFLAKQANYEAALDQYDVAWNLLPAPREQWDAATWISAAKGDALFKEGDYSRAFEQFALAVRCPEGLGNPFVHLRLGQTLYELGDEPQALENLARAYMGAGKEIFSSEPPKYFDALKKAMLSPPGRDSL